MKRSIFILLLALLAAAPLLAQYSPCFEAAFAEGKRLFDQGKYTQAKKYFNEAKQCPDPNTTAVKEWIGKCEKAMRDGEKKEPEATAETIKREKALEAEKKEKRMYENCSSLAACERYLETFPNGKYVLAVMDSLFTLAEKEKTEVEREVKAFSASHPEPLTITVNDVSFVMKPVAGGTFMMGAQKDDPNGTNYSDDADGSDGPVHRVTVSSFYMGETEVTQALWKAVMLDNPSKFKGDDLPVEMICYEDIVHEFLPRLNQLTGKEFRLSTEAEWEYAARGGNNSHGYKCAGSNTTTQVAWCFSNSASTTHPVKMLDPNELGLYDMNGNVAEWCQDICCWSDKYNDWPQVNPKGPAKGTDYRIRGGDYTKSWSICVSRRDYGGGKEKYDTWGFRLALSDSEEMRAERISRNNMVNLQMSSSVFSVAPDRKVHFASGNLQYRASTNTWRFAINQWDVVGEDNKNISPSYDGWIDLFGWGTGSDPTKATVDNNDYLVYSEWGNNIGTGWRTMTNEEWWYVFNHRETTSGIRYAMATVNEKVGVIILPDDWSKDYFHLNKVNVDSAYETNIISLSQWSVLEQHGAVFLPAAGGRKGNTKLLEILYWLYWTSTLDESCEVQFSPLTNLAVCGTKYRYIGHSVRLVYPVKQ